MHFTEPIRSINFHPIGAVSVTTAIVLVSSAMISVTSVEIDNPY